MPRGRSSISSVNGANGVNGAASSSAAVPSTPRRTSRQSITPADAHLATLAAQKKAAPVKKAATPKKPASKRARSVSVAPVEEVDEPEEGEAPKPKKAKALPKPKPKRAPVQGMNAIPERYDRFPASSNFSFEIPAVAKPDELPRTVFIFGNGDMGQHGIGLEGGTVEIVRPRLHILLEKLIATGGEEWKGGVASLECGGMHSLAVDNAGRIWSWGINDNAALGRVTVIPDGPDSEELETQPMLVENVDYENDFKAVKVAASDSLSLAISETGELRCWGSFRDAEGALGFDGSTEASKSQLVPTVLRNLESHSFVQVATGNDHFIALTTKGQVFACGDGQQCQLGRRIIQRHKYHGLTPERLALKNIVVVGSGAFHSFAVDASGKVYAWGSNSFHQTGVSEEDGGWEEVITTPTVVRALDPSLHGGAKVVQIAGGEHHTIFLLSNGEVWGTGRCDGSTMGLGKDHPRMIEMQERENEAKARRADYRAECRARIAKQAPVEDSDGNPGRVMSDLEIDLAADLEAAQTVPLPNSFIPEPTKITVVDEADENGSGQAEQIVQIAVGARASFAVSKDGKLFSWGYGNVAQLGLGDEEEAEKPTRVISKAMGGFRVMHAAAGGQHSACVAVRGPGAKPSIHVNGRDNGKPE